MPDLEQIRKDNVEQSQVEEKELSDVDLVNDSAGLTLSSRKYNQATFQQDIMPHTNQISEFFSGCDS